MRCSFFEQGSVVPRDYLNTQHVLLSATYAKDIKTLEVSFQFSCPLVQDSFIEDPLYFLRDLLFPHRHTLRLSIHLKRSNFIAAIPSAGVLGTRPTNITLSAKETSTLPADGTNIRQTHSMPRHPDFPLTWRCIEVNSRPRNSNVAQTFSYQLCFISIHDSVLF